jgi:uncharacterized protein (DUF1684 family)
MLRCLITVAALLAMSPYQAGIVKWREQKETELKVDGGWLTVTGLFWLKEGANRVEGAPGVFESHDGKVRFRDDSGAITEMGPNASITAGPLTFSVIERSGRYGVRLKDKNSKLRAEFRGQQWFPVRESYRVQARFVSYEQPKSMAVPNILGSTYQMPSPGYAVFTLEGRELRLEPVVEDKKLFFIFRDLTAGKETYGSGRFLYAELPHDGRVELDFNKAENPPCAFTPYATCPLPPKQNVLPVRIEAGELAPAKSAGHGAAHSVAYRH